MSKYEKSRRRLKINPRVRRILKDEAIYLDISDEELRKLVEEYPDINIQQELTEIVRETEKEIMVCPECGSTLVYAKVSSNPMGVGKTYAQAKMRPFAIFYEVVCSNCGLVLDHAIHEVHR